MRKTLAILALIAFAAGAPGTAQAQAAPSVADILSANKAASGGAVWDGKTVLKTDYAYSGQGLTGKAHSLSDLKTGRFADTFEIGPVAGANGFDGTHAWAKDTSGTVTMQEGGDQHALAVNEAYRRANEWWRPDRGGATIAAAEKSENGTRYDVLTVTPKDGLAFMAWFDAKTHLLIRTVEKRGPQTVTATLSDYAAVDGAMLPKKSVIDSGVGAKYIQTLTLTDASFLPPQSDAAYRAPKVSVTDFAIAGGAAETHFPIQLINNHIYGEAKVNGKGPFTFIFDTGGADIVTPKMAKELGLTVEGQLPGTGAGEGVMEGGFAKVAKLEVGGAELTGQVFAVFPLDALEKVEGTKMPGMVGYEVFRRFVTRIDYGAKTVSLIDPKHFDAKDAGTPVPFKFNDHIPEVEGTFEGLPAKYDIDTGSRSELTLTKPFAEANALRAKHPKGVDAVDGWGVGGPSLGYVTMGKAMTIGTVSIGNVVTSLATQTKGGFADASYQGNVGGGILKRFIVTFDYNKQIMYLKPLPGPVADTGTFDRAGMWINEAPDGFEIVDVTKGAPAEKAGLVKGDIVAAVDGKPAKTIELYDLRRRLRNDAPGTAVRFTILRGGKSKDIEVALKNLI